MVLLTLSIWAIVLFLCYYVFFRTSPLDSIPGPKGSLIMGNAPQLKSLTPHIILAKWGKVYNGFFKLKLFQTYVIVVSDPKSINDVMIKHGYEMGGRPNSFRGYVINEDQAGTVLANAGSEHKARRKCMHAYLKQFGRGIERIEKVTQIAIEDMIQRIEQEDGRAFDVRDELFHCMADIIAVILHGERLDKSCIDKIRFTLDTGCKAFGDGSGVLLDMFPWLRHFGNPIYKQCLLFVKNMHEIVDKWTSQRPQTGFISYVQAMSEEEKIQNGIPLKKNQVNVIWEFVFAGTHTSSTTLTTLINVLAHKPEIQEKLKTELDEQFGPEYTIHITDKEKLPYHHATLLEIGRFASIVPLAIPHITVEDVTLKGYAIPKDTQVWINLWALHHDEDLWDEPFSFRPERFLDETGCVVLADHPNRKNLLPFGAGYRVCVGEIFAMARMFMILANIVQRFHIYPETTIDKQPSMDPRDMQLGHVILPPPFKVRMVRR